MTQDFLQLMKDVAAIYGVTVTENAREGGVFYTDEYGNRIRFSDDVSQLIDDSFFIPINTTNISNMSYALNEYVDLAA